MERIPNPNVDINLDETNRSNLSETENKAQSVVTDSRITQRFRNWYTRTNPAQNGSKSSERQNDILDVCPEKYLGTSVGYPYWVEGHITIKCQNARPLEDVISIAFVCKNPTEYIFNMFPTVLKSINDTYPTVRVLLGLTDSRLASHTRAYPNIELVATNPKHSYGTILRNILRRVKTPYVFIGRELFSFNRFADLERQIRVMSKHEKMAAVGGAFRNSTAHWKNGCYQSEARMHTLKYIAGYYESKWECLYCDMLTSSFVVKTKCFKDLEMEFATDLDTEFMFRDWFFKIKAKGLKVMACPDVMYFMSDETQLQAVSKKQLWKPFATKWQFDYIMPDHVTTFKFTCEEIAFQCNMMATKSYILPTCCFDQMAQALRIWVEFSQKYNISYELQTGSVLAAVKLEDMMPWDLDGDIDVQSKFYDFIYNHRKEFVDQGISISGWSKSKRNEDGTYAGGKFNLNVPLYFEMFGKSKLSTESYLPKELGGIPTKLTLHGITVNGPVNPGLYARNRYGVECYKHSQSWIIHGFKDSHQQYNAGLFTKCIRPGFHACLDEHPIDGNIPFKIDV